MSEIKVKVIIDGSESIQTIDELNQSLDSFKKNTEGLDSGSEEVDNFNKSLEELQNTLDSGLELNLDAESFNQTLQEVSADLTELTGQQFDIQVDVPEQASLNLRELRAALKDAKDEAASAQFGTPEFDAAAIKAGELSEQIKDVNEAINAQSGEPIERVTRQFAGLGESLITLDFDKATKQLGTLNKTISTFDFNKVAKGAGEFGKVLGGNLKNAVSSLGKTLLANPLFLLAAVIVGVVVAVVELKDKFEIIQVAIDAATLPIRTLIQTFKDLSDALGLSNFEEQENLEKTSDAYGKKVEEIDKATQKELKLAQARGASAEELLGIEERAAQERAALAQKQLDENASYLKSLQKKVDGNRVLTDKEKEDYEKLKVAVDDLADAQFELQVITAKRGTAAAEQAAKDAEKSAKDTEKARQEYAKYLDDLQKLTDKYILTDRQRIEKQFDADIKRIKGTTALERQLIAEIQKDKEAALIEFDAKQLKQSQDLQLKIRENELKIQTDRALEAAQTAEQIVAIEKAVADETLAIELARIDIIKNEQIALAKGNAELIKKAEQDAIIATTEALEKRDSTVKESNTKLLEDRKKKLEEETKSVIEASNKQLEEIKSDRQQILQDFDSGELGIFGTLKKLQNNFDKERAAVQKQASDLIAIQQSIIDSTTSTTEERKKAEEEILKIKQDAADKDLELTRQTEAAKSEIINAEVQKRVSQAQDAVDIIQSFSDTQLENERGRLDILTRENEQYFEGERERIENSTLSEEEKQKALDELARIENDRKNQLAKQDLLLKKKEIKRERAFAIARIALGIASSFPDGIKAAVKTDPVSFALTLAANLALIVGTLAAAKRALNDADSQIGALGGDTGGDTGGNIQLPTPSGAGGQAPQFSPAGFQPTGVNPAQGGSGAQQGQVQQPQQFVSVVEIERVRNSVSVIENGNTIFGGG